MTAKALSSYILTDKYANHMHDAKRRENWDEATERVFGMHRRKYTDVEGIESYIDEAEDAFREMVALGSQRVLQYAGVPIERKNARGYNCVSSFIDRPRVFQEAFWLLLCGCGTGFSVQWHHVDKLPAVKAPGSEHVVFQIPDTIEGWGDALGVLMSSYFDSDNTPFPEFRGRHVVFDFDLIRPEGSALSSGNGKAPGPEPLRKTIDRIRKLLDRCCARNAMNGEAVFDDEQAYALHHEGKLQPIDVYDIIMHASDAVLAGGVRRSASICVFSPTDTAMRNSKIGAWTRDNPQRARSNNSALLLRGKTTKAEFDDLVACARQWGEPGFYWSDSTEQMPNPCQPAWAPIMTRDGLKTMGDIKVGDEIWSESGWTKVIKKWSTGIKPVLRYQTTAGAFIGTEQHRIVSGGQKIEVGQADSIDRLVGPVATSEAVDVADIVDGLMIGDGTFHRAGGGMFLTVGDDDGDYFTDSDIAPLILERGYGGNEKLVRIGLATVGEPDLPGMWNRKVPERFMYANTRKIRGFLRGLFSANGCVVESAKRVSLKTTSPHIRDGVQLMLSAIGIRSYFTENKERTTKFENGTYTSRKSYDVHITSDAGVFARLVGFIQRYKQDKLSRILDRRVGTSKNTYDVIAVEDLGSEEVFDITVDNDSHTYWSGGLNVSNCVEASFWPVDEVTGETGWQFCNLSLINMAKVRTREQFARAARAAAIMGTLQAGYTDFGYLGGVSERITRRESLLGVSMTGMMEAPDLVFDPQTLRDMAKVVLDVNAEVAALIGIMPAARATLIKPEGTSSCLLETCSGIHTHHARRYFRRVQANHNELPAQFFREHNPRAVEQSAHSRTKTDLMLTFCIEAPSGSLVSEDVGSQRLLELVKLVKENWVDAGKRVEACTQPWLSHNVSNTIYVGEDEWPAVSQYIFDNQHTFAGVALLSDFGELDFQQAPFCSVLTAEEIVAKYGSGAMMASGLIVDGVRVFGNDLWIACDTVLDCQAGIGVDIGRDPKPDDAADKETLHQQREWVRRARQFAERYFDGNVKEMTYCLKRVSNLKLWHDLQRETVDVDYTQMREEEDNTSFAAQSACAGGACVIV